MDQELFTKSYFQVLARRLAGYGYEPKQLIDAVWKGTKAMVTNTGERLNEDVFWTVFADIFGPDSLSDQDRFLEFYQTDFPSLRPTCGFNPKSAPLLRQIKEAGLRTILATNPIFPQIATLTRIGWAGLDPKDFEWITTYENSHYCKPNPAYYQEILTRASLTPEECLMVGNDVGEDMVAASLGMKVFLLTDCLINREEKDISLYPHGNMDDLSAYIATL
jgi:FMN phosphatase YigB (HAD superfamily)